MKTDDFYIKDGVKYDRVTRVLDYVAPPGLIDWKLRVGKKEANRIGKEATRIGEKLHKSIEDGKLVKKATIEVRNCWEAYQKWLKEYPSVVEAREETLYDPVLKIAGTPDLLTTDTVVDYKTSRIIRPSYWLQTSVYAHMAKKEKIAILRLDKNLAVFEYEVRAYDEKLMDIFVGLLNVYRYYKQEEKDDEGDLGVTTEEINDRQEVARPEVPDVGAKRDW